jgi:O-antigen/teichoic acid export membrane protein
MLVQAGLTVLPLLVVGILGSRDNAFFYLPLLIVSAFDALFATACTSLVVAGAADVRRQSELARLMARRALLLLLPGALALVALAPYILLVFGADYSEHATTMMRLLALSSIPRAAHSLYAALARFRGDGRAILLRQVLSVAALVAGTAVLAPTIGLTGVGLAWLGSSLLVLATVVRGLRQALR